MAVDANFTYALTSGVMGVAPFTVAFTDTSTGSPNNWRYDFGDGFTSNAQNPTHTFTANGFPTVKLTAFVSTGTSTVNEVFVSGRNKQGTGGTAAAALTSFLAASWTNTPPGSNGIRFSLGFIHPTFTLTGEEATYSYNLGSESGDYAELQIFFNTAPNPPGTKVVTGSGKKVDPVTTGVWLPVRDVTSSLGSTIQESWAGDSYIFGGWDYVSAGTKVVTFTATDLDSITKTLETLSVDFVGTPLLGNNIQTVNFTDLSSDGVTAWSWRKRKAGTSDVFVEFSTLENPSHNFDRDNP